MRNTVFVNDEYYHIYNRGTEKRKIFLCEEDYQRFIYGIRIFNSVQPTVHLFNHGLLEVSPRAENMAVKIIAYCLMPNHFHLLVKQASDNGVSKFIHKLSTGYTMYFNKRYERTGVLFQGVFKSKHVNNDSYLLHLSRYIHLNPFELLISDYKNRKEIIDLLKKYKWSSYSEYVESNKDEFITENREIILDQLGGRNGYQKFVLSIIGKNIDCSRFRLER